MDCHELWQIVKLVLCLTSDVFHMTIMKLQRNEIFQPSLTFSKFVVAKLGRLLSINQ